MYRVILVYGTRQLYSVPPISFEILSRVIATKPAAFMKSAVKHLFLSSQDQDPADVVLSACTHVTNLWVQFPLSFTFRPRLLLFNAFPRVRRLSVTIDIFMESSSIGDVDPLFRNLTHLHLRRCLWDPAVPNLCAKLSVIPHVTHICFSDDPYDTLFYTALRFVTHFHCILFLSCRHDTHPLADDERFVYMRQNTHYCVDWLRGTATREDFWDVAGFWAIADEFIAARRTGKVDREYSNNFPLWRPGLIFSRIALETV